MKKILAIFACAVILLGLTVGSLYFFLFRPNTLYIEENKKVVAQLSKDFIECMLQGAPETCGSKYGTSEMQSAAPPSKLEMFGGKMKKNLGPLKGFSIIEKTMGWQTFSLKSGSVLKFYFTAKTPFEQDEAATIDFTFIKSTEWPIRLNTFMINSEQMLK